MSLFLFRVQCFIRRFVRFFVRFWVAGVVFVGCGVFAVPVVAGDVELGGILAQSCVACHGERGAKPIADYPVLAGQYEAYLVVALRAYKSGRRVDGVMAGQVAGLSLRDIDNLSAYFAGQGSGLR